MSGCVCKACGKTLTLDEVSLYRKLVNRFPNQYLCMPCLADYFSVSVPLLEEKICYFKKIGCSLFTDQ